MKYAKKRWDDYEDILAFKEISRHGRQHFSRTRALKVKRELRRLAYY